MPDRAPMALAARRIGLLSDSHGRAERTGRAVRLLADAGAEVLLYLGDVESTAVIDALLLAVGGSGQPLPPARMVFGNVDYHHAELAGYAESLGIAVDHPAGWLSLGERTLVYTHGHRREELERALASGVDYLCHGHTHCRRDERVGATRVINPGALHRASVHTVALIDTAADRLEFLEVAR